MNQSHWLCFWFWMIDSIGLIQIVIMCYSECLIVFYVLWMILILLILWDWILVLAVCRGGLAERLNRLHSRQKSAISFWRHQCNSTTSAGKTHPIWFLSVYMKTQSRLECKLLYRSLVVSSLFLTTNVFTIRNEVFSFKYCQCQIWPKECARKLFIHQPTVFIFP